MGKTYRELKKKIGQLRFENSFLTFKVEKVLLENGRVKRELQVSNARIVELAQDIELLKNGLPFADEVKEALEGFSVGITCLPTEFEGLVSLGYIEEFAVAQKNKISPLFSSSDIDRELELFTRANPTKKEEKAFSSRFMPDVKFTMRGDITKISDVISIFVLQQGYLHFVTTACGEDLLALTPSAFLNLQAKEVSIYEAIPGLVPKGMFYDKESDSLIKKDKR